MFLLKFIVPIIIVLAIVMLFLLGYVKAPPDRAFIISGLGREPRILTGRAGIKMPFLERKDVLYLGQMSVDIKTEQSVPTNDFINVNVDAVAKVRIEPSAEGIHLAAKNFLNKSPDQIARDLQDSLQGNMREIIGTLTLKAINIDRDSFSDQVMEKASKDMKKLGIEILSCNIQNVTDDNGLIRDLGMDNTARIKKDAAIAKAQADRDVAIAQAQAEKSANDARVESETEIAKRRNELEIKKSELKMVSDVKKAEADAAYEIQNQEQQKTIQTATVNASIARAERETELKKTEAAVRQQELVAEVEKKADAEKYAAEKRAEAELVVKQRAAEAEQYQAEREAAGIRAKYEAEAAGIRARGEAEAEKAEAYAKYNKAAMAEMVIRVLPQIASEISKPLAQIDKITIIGGGDGSSNVGPVADNVPVVMAKMFQTMKEVTGVDLGEIMRADTYDAKVNRNIHVDGVKGLALDENKESVSENVPAEDTEVSEKSEEK